MDEELIRRVNRNARRLDDLVLPERSPDLVSPFLALTMLRGFWVASADENGDWFDFSGQGRTLSYNGDPALNDDGLALYWDLDGTGDFFDRGDEAGLDISGTETYVDADVRGLTAGCWVWVDELGDWEHFFCKWDSWGVNQRCWRLMQGAAANTQVWFVVSDDGTATKAVISTTGTLTTGAWHFAVGRFIPSTSVTLFLDGIWYSNTTAVPASLFNSNASLVAGGHPGPHYLMDGRLALCFLCAAALSDAHVSSLFNQTKAAFRV